MTTLSNTQTRALEALELYSAYLNARAAGERPAWPAQLAPIGFGGELVRRLERDDERRRVVFGRVAEWLRSDAAADHSVIRQQHLRADCVDIGRLITYVVQAYRLGWR